LADSTKFDNNPRKMLIEVDNLLISQVDSSLVPNALKVSKQGTVYLFRRQNVWTLVVTSKDTGSGFELEVI
jgi:K+-sensing histidine kinase KdpD